MVICCMLEHRLRKKNRPLLCAPRAFLQKTENGVVGDPADRSEETPSISNQSTKHQIKKLSLPQTNDANSN